MLLAQLAKLTERSLNIIELRRILDTAVKPIYFWVIYHYILNRIVTNRNYLLTIQELCLIKFYKVYLK